MRAGPGSLRPRTYVVLAVVAVVGVAGVLWFAPAGPLEFRRSPVPPGPIPANGTLVSYNSTADGTRLSFYEWLPDGFSAARTYPLAVYLHGQSLDGDELIVHAGGSEVIAAAMAAGYLLISLNTRSPSGFYVNSPFSGPQEQDVLDAIHVEEGLRHVGLVYLFGSSMGTVGAYSLAAHHVGMFAGIGAINSCSDFFEAVEWRLATGNSASLDGVNSTLGALPGSTPTATGLAYYLSAGRFFPQNLSGIKVYVTQGGADVDCPNNPALTDYQNANDTLLASTCVTVPSLGEPAGCTSPRRSLNATTPGEFPWRFVYEPEGVHNLDEINATDLFAYWSGDVGDGLEWAQYPLGADLHPVVP